MSGSDYHEKGPGHCPKCGAQLEYSGNEFNGENVDFNAECPECGWCGSERYYLEFVCFCDEYGEEM